MYLNAETVGSVEKAIVRYAKMLPIATPFSKDTDVSAEHVEASLEKKYCIIIPDKQLKQNWSPKARMPVNSSSFSSSKCWRLAELTFFVKSNAEASFLDTLTALLPLLCRTDVLLR